MKEFEEIGKRMPYMEDKDYVSRLVGACADSAIAAFPVRKKRGIIRRIYFIATGVAAAVLIGVMSVTYVNKMNTIDNINQSQSLNQVLSSLSDEDVMNVSYYTVDDIPEY